jgi:SAM-dependent methyltransferase
MIPYATVGRFYDAAMGDRRATAAYIRRLIVQHKAEAKTLLELACGTGAILQSLAKYYDVVGLDLSPEMLSFARKRLPHVQLFRKDMVTFDLRRKFDVIICVFDSINHVLRFADWKRIFRRVALHLDDEGLFLFDMNTMQKLQRQIRTPARVIPLGRNLLTIKVTDEGRGMANWNIKVFERKARGNCELFEENIKEISFPLKKIKDALREQFAEIKVIDPTGQRPSGISDRLYFVCAR